MRVVVVTATRDVESRVYTCRVTSSVRDPHKDCVLIVL